MSPPGLPGGDPPGVACIAVGWRRGPRLIYVPMSRDTGVDRFGTVLLAAPCSSTPRRKAAPVPVRCSPGRATPAERAWCLFLAVARRTPRSEPRQTRRLFGPRREQRKLPSCACPGYIQGHPRSCLALFPGTMRRFQISQHFSKSSRTSSADLNF